MDPKITVLLVGIVLILIGIFNIVKGLKLKKRCTVKVAGKICDIDVEKQSKQDGGNEYRPIVSYTYEGSEYKSNLGIVTKSKKAYSIGDSVDILVNPDKPDEFLRAKGNNNVAIGIIFIFVGALLIFLIPYVG